MSDNNKIPGQALEFDYIVVGAGTAGCLLANRLSANPENRGLLIEAGGRDNYHWIHIPVGYLYCIDNPRTDWRFRTDPIPGLNGRELIYPRDKTLGGCSSINGMLYIRGQARDYNHWADVTGDDAWSWDNCLPDFMRHEDHCRLDEGGDADLSHREFHGHGGEWRIERQRLKWPVLEDFAEAAVEAYDYASIQYHVQPLSLDTFGQPLHSFPAITASVCNLNPGSRGTVRIRSRDPRDAPAIAPNYLNTEEDRKVAADSLRVTRRIAEQQAFAKYRPEEFKPGLEYQTDDDMAVVDSHLRVKGVHGLRVVDAGVMPTITSGNTNSPTLMIAEKAAKWILAGA